MKTFSFNDGNYEYEWKGGVMRKVIATERGEKIYSLEDILYLLDNASGALPEYYKDLNISRVLGSKKQLNIEELKAIGELLEKTAEACADVIKGAAQDISKVLRENSEGSSPRYNQDIIDVEITSIVNGRLGGSVRAEVSTPKNIQDLDDYVEYQMNEPLYTTGQDEGEALLEKYGIEVEQPEEEKTIDWNNLKEE